MPAKCNEKCGLFDFMANNIGIRVLHPGGYQSTSELSSLCNINADSLVLDLACGTGTTTFFLSDKYKCTITGIDISESLIEIGKKILEKRTDRDSITLTVADALTLPYPDNSFDVVVSQAFFILIDEKQKALSEISRVLRPGGYWGALELSWFAPPSREAYEELISRTCSDFIPRVATFDEWESFFSTSHLSHIKTVKRPMSSGILHMLRSEGMINFGKIMYKMIVDGQSRTRMMEVQKAFHKYDNYLGYGIYCYRKP